MRLNMERPSLEESDEMKQFIERRIFKRENSFEKITQTSDMRFGLYGERQSHIFPTDIAIGDRRNSSVKSFSGRKSALCFGREIGKKNFCSRLCHPQRVLRFLLEDWLFLVVLGIIMALLSFSVDYCVNKLFYAHALFVKLAGGIGDHITSNVVAYFFWTLPSVAFILIAAICVHFFAPPAIGSGIPEMKTILHGVVLKEYLTFNTLVFKIFGLVLAIGSGLPVGKEGPFVHIGSMVASLLSRLVYSFRPVYANESRHSELLAAGCAAGVASTFGAPVGGVLFSIEVTSVYFAVRDYWRGFFAAACGCVFFSLLRLTHSSEATVVAFFQTQFVNQAVYPEELITFAFMGFFCGIMGAIFIFLHRRLVLGLRKNPILKFLFQRNFLVYPAFISALYFTIVYPNVAGKFVNGQVVFSHALKDFLVNCTWLRNLPNSCNNELILRWSAAGSIFIQLSLFFIFFYLLVIVVSTIPIPAGIFMPAFVLGAGIGRLFGELMVNYFPNGIRNNGEMLNPGIYSIVGAASFCGAVTHTVSVAVIAFELTGQILHMIPVMIAVIIANITCSSFQPSIFDSIIRIKRLPYLPDIPKPTSEVHEIRVEQIMNRNVIALSKQNHYSDLQQFLLMKPRLEALPVVDSQDSLILLGSVSRLKLVTLLNDQIGDEARQSEANRRELLQFFRKREDPNDLAVKNEFESQLTVSSIANLKLNMDELNAAEEAKNQNEEVMSIQSQDDIIVSTDGSGKRINFIRKLFIFRCSIFQSLSGVFRNFTRGFYKTNKKSPSRPDLFDDEREQWELIQLAKKVKFDSCTIDPAPFQLTEDTSLFKVHTLFSMLGLKRAYVTKCGVLVGVVSLKEVRSGIERAQSGELNAKTRSMSFGRPRLSSQVSRGFIVDEDASSEDSDDSDIHKNDYILPRVKPEDKKKKSSPTTKELERRLSAAPSIYNQSGSIRTTVGRSRSSTTRTNFTDFWTKQNLASSSKTSSADLSNDEKVSKYEERF